MVLAREFFFGDEVMGQCTAKGHADKPGLPHRELMELKDVIKGAYPQYWNAPHAFESQCLLSGYPVVGMVQDPKLHIFTEHHLYAK